jgi:hypothetical protein
MVRINLLPKHILEKRRYEKWYQYVFFAFGALLIFVLLIWGLFYFQATAKNDELLALKEQSTQLQAKADAFGVFEKKEQDLAGREQIAQTALAGRVNMGRVANEVSLVLPDEVWLSQMSISEKDGLLLSALTPQSSSQSMDIGYKSVAKTLVRLNELIDIYDVWLSGASNGTYQLAAEGTQTAPPPNPVVQFQANGKVVVPALPPVAAPAVPAPPSTGTK